MLKQTDTITLIIDGVEVSSSLPPYLWMYPDPNHKLTIDVNFTDNSKTDSARLESRVRFYKATKNDVHELLAKTKFINCSKCGKITFDHKVMDTNRGGECETCFMEALNARAEVSRLKEMQKTTERDKKMFSKGYRYRLTLWIHPKDGGEDYGLESCSKKELSEEKIQRKIEKEGSAILNDYTQIKIEG